MERNRVDLECGRDVADVLHVWARRSTNWAGMSDASRCADGLFFWSRTVLGLVQPKNVFLDVALARSLCHACNLI